jgi:hypothetical protein
MGPLEVLAVVPLYNTVFKLTHTMGVAEYLKHPVSQVWLLTIFRIRQYGFLGRNRQLRRKPLY